ncbi:MAG: response regulator [Geminicoccaceae bacterium]
MKIVVIGASGRIGAKLVYNLCQEDCTIFAASLSFGVNTVTGVGLARALRRAGVVLDVSDSPSSEGAAALRFFETSGLSVREALSDLLLVVGLSSRPYDRVEALLAEYGPGAIDCVITDVRMSGMNGLELLWHLRLIDGAVPVIVITSDTSLKTRRQALEGGAHAFMIKPVEDDTLLGHLQSTDS